VTRPRVALVIVAAGSSRRMEGIDKVWADLAGHPIVRHSLIELGPLADATALVVRPDQVERAEIELAGSAPNLTIVPGGAERQDSVARGLERLPPLDVVAVHDAARPLARAGLLRTGIELIQTFDGALPVTPVQDTVKEVDRDGVVVRTLDRSLLRAAQTPQVFRREALLNAHRRARNAGLSGTDDASLVEQAGYRVTVFPGSPANLKITTPDDLRIARLLLQQGMAV
jgi:2-C-methyl-D-erythritol 4-phosphate cytidylyltransferase